MKIAALVFGLLLGLGGLVWILQGVNVLPGSLMSGDPRWAWRGAVILVVGVALIVVSRRR